MANNPKITAYIHLAKYFKKHGYSLYLVGGTVRDFLLHLPLKDMDLVTDALPTQVKELFEESNDAFMKYGVLKVKYQNVKFDIATLRKEGKYDDSRHPSKIKFVKDVKKDYRRRDFTINAMYLDYYFNVYDYCHGQEDLKNKVIRFVGRPKRRIKEDPLRIMRAIRFALKYNFTIEDRTSKAMKKYSYLLEKINPEKIKEEIHKIGEVNPTFKNKLFKEYGIHQLIDVVN